MEINKRKCQMSPKEKLFDKTDSWTLHSSSMKWFSVLFFRHSHRSIWQRCRFQLLPLIKFWFPTPHPRKTQHWQKCSCVVLWLAGCQRPPRVLYHPPPASAGQGEKSLTQGSWLEIRAGRAPCNYCHEKSDSTWGYYVNLLPLKSEKTPPPHPSLPPGINLIPNSSIPSPWAVQGKEGYGYFMTHCLCHFFPFGRRLLTLCLLPGGSPRGRTPQAQPAPGGSPAPSPPHGATGPARSCPSAAAHRSWPPAGTARPGQGIPTGWEESLCSGTWSPPCLCLPWPGGGVLPPSLMGLPWPTKGPSRSCLALAPLDMEEALASPHKSSPQKPCHAKPLKAVNS